VPATKADPHQVSDGRYYRRHNYNRLVMEHYEVRDSMRRPVDPALVIDFDLFHGDAAYKNVEFNEYRDQSDPIALGAVVRNNSNQPSMYTVVSIFIDRRVKIVNSSTFEIPNFQKFGETDIRHHLRHSMGIPGGYPIFREMPVSLGPLIGCSVKNSHSAMRFERPVALRKATATLNLAKAARCGSACRRVELILEFRCRSSAVVTAQ
jgi:hypothetical protein